MPADAASGRILYRSQGRRQHKAEDAHDEDGEPTKLLWSHLTFEGCPLLRRPNSFIDHGHRAGGFPPHSQHCVTVRVQHAATYAEALFPIKGMSASSTG
jgi:hypothetical protein